MSGVAANMYKVAPNGTNGGHAAEPAMPGVELVDIADANTGATRQEQINNSPPAGNVDIEKPAPDEDEHIKTDVTYLDIFKNFFLLGWTAFGGPAAHIAFFEKIFVDRLHWMTASVYTELYALGQCIPGPTSTQVSFAIGAIKRGVAGGLLSGMLFQYPGLIIMSVIGWVVADAKPKGWRLGAAAGLSAVAVALVASAARSLLTKACPDKVTGTLAVLSAGAVYYWTEAYMFPLVILIGAITTLITRWNDVIPPKDEDKSVQHLGVTRPVGAGLLVVWAAVLIAVIVAVRVIDTHDTPLHWFEAFYRIGSITYGGGQVVLPMLYNEVVSLDCRTEKGQRLCTERGDSWVTVDQYYSGLGLAQALPGPLFNFAAYLGAITAKRLGYFPLLGIVLCWVGLFAPGILLIFGILPYWGRFRNWTPYKKALPGANAAAVGLIVTACFQFLFDVVRQSPFPIASVTIGIFGYGASDVLKIFEPIVVGAGAVLGIIGWAVDSR